MTELKIEITKKNKDKILQLISELIDSESEGSITLDGAGGKKEATTRTTRDEACLAIPSEGANIPLGAGAIEKSSRGCWGMTNSFFPGKASLRVLAKMSADFGTPVAYSEFIEKCATVFKDASLNEFRGFPNQQKWESSVNRMSVHLIRPFIEMGLIHMGRDEMGDKVTLTEEGLEFARLPNGILDKGSDEQVLSEEEANWFIKYLKKIDSRGFSEYSILSKLLAFLKEGKKSRNDLTEWFERRPEITDEQSQNSLKSDPGALKLQLRNIANTFASGKIALLRELGVISPERNQYTILKEL